LRQIENRINIFKNKEEYFKSDIKEKIQTIEKMRTKLDQMNTSEFELSETKDKLNSFIMKSKTCKELS
jgi:DNA repair ATPase RecN